MSLERDIGWLAGAIDGEGCQQLNLLQGRRGKPFPMERWIRFVDGEPIPCQSEGSVEVITSAGVEASFVSSASDNRNHERPAPHLKASK